MTVPVPPTTILDLQNLIHNRQKEAQALLTYLKNHKMNTLLTKYFPNEKAINEQVNEQEIKEDEGDEEKAKLYKERGKQREERGDMVTQIRKNETEMTVT
jgi:hypothetical protein